jgi:hypothetical protein
MKKIFAALFLFVLFALPAPALADIAPPYQPPGASLEPGKETTQVRMLAENVLIDVKPGSGDSLGTAQVTADFTMRNLGDQTETMAVRFPISANDGRFGKPEIKNLQVQVNGNNIGTKRIQGEDPYWGGDQVPWAEFQVKFPPGKDVPIRVTYTLEGMGYQPFVSFNYILSTGAGWKDTIGSADLIVRLPYQANEQNVILGTQIGWSETTPGASLEGKEIRWHYENLEPERENNLDVALVMPAKWQKVLKEQANVAKNPDDGEAWGRLGKLYKELAFLPRELRPDAGGQALYDLSVQAYEKCLELKPNDALWHVGFAELYYWHHNVTHWLTQDDDSDLRRTLALLQRAIEINPKTTQAVEMLDDISSVYPEYIEKTGDGYVFLYLTATPQVFASQTSTAVKPTATEESTAAPFVPNIKTAVAVAAASTRTPTAILEPTIEPTQPSPTQVAPTQASVEPTAAAGKTGTGLCGTGLLLPLVVIAVVGRRRRV